MPVVKKVTTTCCIAFQYCLAYRYYYRGFRQKHHKYLGAILCVCVSFGYKGHAFECLKLVLACYICLSAVDNIGLYCDLVCFWGSTWGSKQDMLYWCKNLDPCYQSTPVFTSVISLCLLLCPCLYQIAKCIPVATFSLAPLAETGLVTLVLMTQFW